MMPAAGGLPALHGSAVEFQGLFLSDRQLGWPVNMSSTAADISDTMGLMVSIQMWKLNSIKGFFSPSALQVAGHA